MTAPEMSRQTIRSEAEMAALAQAIAPCLRPGDVLLLQGEIGAGKTFFARALIQERLSSGGLWEEVPSPTYTLVQTYWDGSAEIWHADLYRLDGPDGAVELGLDAAFETAICLVEWPDRLAELAPNDALWVGFAVCADAEHRRVTFRSLAPRWVSRLREAGVASGDPVA